MHFNKPGDFEVIAPDSAHIRTEEYALFMTPLIEEWVKEFGLDVIGMRALRDALRASRKTSVH
jgi:chitin disaccharide deacetylase